ncbi:hypothetical protein G9A89_004924 [Geosiphon pyriformis]|nr:hypothetical protein G9A89_004924 [Geosiphon pyriformis]
MAVTSVIKNVGLHWSHFSLASCAVCKNFGHMFLSCRFVKDATVLNGRRAALLAQDQLKLVRIYVKKSAPISCLLAFGGKNLGSQFGSIINGESLPTIVDKLEKCLASIESSLVSLAGQIGELAKRLDSLMPANPEGDIVMEMALSKTTSKETAAIVDSSRLSKSVLSLSARFESSLIWKVAICNIKGMTNPAKQDDIIYWHNNMNNLISIFTETKVFTSGLDSGYLAVGVVIAMNSSLARHVCKVSEVPGWLLSIKLLFKNKLSVSILGLYVDTSSVVRFFQAGEINSLIAKAVNEFSFVILGGDFNEDGLRKSASFKKCLNLGLVNSLLGSPVVKSPTWKNSKDVKKTIDYVFVSSSLVNAIIYRNVLDVGEHYDTDYWAFSVSIGLVEFSLKTGKQGSLENNFKNAMLVNTTMFSDEFATSAWFSDLDTIEVFKKKWFKGFDNVFTKKSLRFHKLELLVFKIVKALCEECVANFESFMGHWVFLDNVRASVVQGLVDSGAGTDVVCSALFGARRSYHAFKLAESLRVKKANIRSAIDKRMENFEVVLDHLVMGNKLILESDLIKSNIDNIMERWTRKWLVAFSGVMCVINFDELHHVVSNLLDGKATVLGLLLVLLNSCLSCELIPGPWKKTWVSMIPKPYEWKGVLMNTHPIALIKTAHKILSKILLDRISLACSSHNILRGNNFSVLKSTATQSPIFAIGSVIENTLEKN